MSKRFWVIFLIALIIVPITVIGCKGRVDKSQETMPVVENTEMMQMPQADTMVVAEPAQVVASETIPPTAAPEITPKPVAMPSSDLTRAKDIQTALKNAGFYAGSIDGKIGPKTKKAIEEFQRAKALKVDGKVGPKTWAELQQYLTQQ